jgi:predicted transcriptional regulator
MIAYAFKANTGGSKPPTPADIDHTIELLLERGGNQKSIADWLGLPTKMVRKYVDDVRSRLARAKLMRAVDAVLNGGLSVAKAAEQYDVDLDRLKEHLSGKKKKPSHGINAIHQKLTYNYKSISSQNAALFRKLIIQYDDGDVTKKQATEIIEHLEGLQRKSARALAEWKARLETKFSNGEGKVGNVA